MAAAKEDALPRFAAALEAKGIAMPEEPEAMRFIRARKYDVDAAVKQYTEMLEWRKDNVPADILGPDPDEAVYRALCPHSNHKFSKRGFPIYYEKTGVISLPRLLKHLPQEKVIRRHIRQQEIAMQRMREESERRGERVEKQVVVLDLKGLSLMPSSTGIAIFKEVIRIDQSYYPEVLAHFIFINAPWIFTPLWALIRPWLDPETRDKFHVLGGSYQGKLLELIEADSLPEEYGGTCRCEGGCIKELVPLPEEKEGEK